MCGLTGILSFTPGQWPVAERTLLAMRDTMVHRVPFLDHNFIRDDFIKASAP